MTTERCLECGESYGPLLNKVGLNASSSYPTAIPGSATEYLHASNPRLLELRERYAGFAGPPCSSSRWSRYYVQSEVPLLNFRGECAFVWQRRDFNFPINYVVSAYHVLAGPHGSLLQRLTDDGLFGAEIVKVNRSLKITRDILDSVLEMSFLDRRLTHFINCIEE